MRCPGSGKYAGSIAERMMCRRCYRHNVRVRRNGRFYVHVVL